ncbi:MAG: glycoside hydrolase family 3 C-terminal domain-containing protein [Lachnospiraceae bacterium]|nr:glycoside hydrolase family 3 C-terminal domain-containing protein [Lachnospiraceae bacterium]
MAVKASDHLKYYANEGGPVISTVTRKIIEKDGLFFKDIDGTGEVSAVNDWRIPAKERAQAYVETLTTEEKIGQLFISDWRMGKYPAPKGPMNPIDPKDIKLDESGILDEGEFRGKTIFGDQYLPGTSVLLKEWFARHLILRANPTPNDMTDYLNQLQAVAEECRHFVPVIVASNSRNEHGEAVFGMNDAVGVFPAWPGTLGIAAAIKGDRIAIADEFADCVRDTWNSAGLRKGYMYMADVMSDPRWQRTYGTFGEDPELICEILRHIIPRIQGSEDGVTADGVAMTVKHFPGGGARENGFDPHYKMGQWNVYQTEGSLQKYHLPGFQTAVDCKAASIMPYYAKPAKEKSAVQLDKNGNPIEMKPYGFAYNRPFLDELLRKQMGFEGYINSDTGIVHNMNWGVEMLEEPERIGFAVNNAGVDVISGLFDNEYGMEAYRRGKNDYYDTHPVPEGFSKEELVLTDEALNRAVARTLTEMFELGMFENPYRDPVKAAETAVTKRYWEQAMDAHRKSVTLLKNDGTLPLTAEKLAGKRVYAEAFHKRPEMAERMTKQLKELLKDRELVEEPAGADYAILMLSPSSGEYFNATPGYLELDICEDKEVCNVDEEGRPTEQTHLETTLTGAGRIAQIAQAVHGNGGKVIANVNFTLAWQLGSVEPYVDALTAGYDTYPSATLDVMFGQFVPSGRLPITLPKDDEVLKVDANGVCISPNDVPGYDKDQYMPDERKDENGKAYAYRDAAGHYYEMNFGMTYEPQCRKWEERAKM